MLVEWGKRYNSILVNIPLVLHDLNKEKAESTHTKNNLSFPFFLPGKLYIFQMLDTFPSFKGQIKCVLFEAFPDSSGQVIIPPTFCHEPKP